MLGLIGTGKDYIFNVTKTFWREDFEWDSDFKWVTPACGEKKLKEAKSRGKKTG